MPSRALPCMSGPTWANFDQFASSTPRLNGPIAFNFAYPLGKTKQSPSFFPSDGRATTLIHLDEPCLVLIVEIEAILIASSD